MTTTDLRNGAAPRTNPASQAWTRVAVVGLIGVIVTAVVGDHRSGAVVLAALAVASVIVIAIVTVRSRHEHGWIWLAVGGGAALTAAATTLAVWQRQDHTADPGAIPAGLYIAGHLVMFIGLMTAARLRRPTAGSGATLDAVILGAAATLVTWRSGLSSAIDRSDGAVIQKLVVVAVPVLGILAFTFLLRRAFSSPRASGVLGLVLVGTVFTIVAPVVSGIAVLDHAHRGGQIPYQLIFITAFTAAALHPDRLRLTGAVAASDQRFGAVRVALLSLALIDAPVVLLLEQGQVTRANIALVAAACMISIVVIIRLVSLARDMEKVRARERTRDQRFESLVRNSSDLIVVLDRAYAVTYLSPAIKEVMGYSPATLLGLNALDAFHREDVDGARSLLDRLGPDGASELRLIRLMHASGTWRWIEARAVNLLDDPTVQGIVVNCRDVTQRVMAQAVIDDSIARQSAIAHLGRIALAAPDARSLTKRASVLIRSTLEVASCEILLFDGDTVTDAVVATSSGTTLSDDLSQPDRGILDTCLDSEDPIQFTDPNPNGPLHSDAPLELTSLEMTLNRPETIVPEDITRRPPQVLAVHVADRERVMGVVLVRSGTPRSFRDDEAAFLDTMAGTLGLALSRRMTEASARHQALHDTLTGLPNRALFVDRLTNALARIRRTDHRVAVLFLDIDHFKVVNDSLGHSMGDRILVEVADRLSTLVRPGDTVARFGGDEFTVLLDPLGPHDHAEKIAERIRATVSRATRVGSAELQPTVSIGVAIANSRDANAETLLRDADAAMYQAKEHGRDNVAVFDDTMRDRVIHRLQTEMDLPRAIAENELFMRYQPIVSLADGAVVGLEALVRWRHPELGEISPDQFIPVAELSGLIGDLDRWVMRTVMTECARTHRGGPSEGPWYALNISARTVAGRELASDVAATLAATGAPPEMICLEITESALMHDMEHSITVLDALRDLGVGISVDDFGTGYSSLSYLRRLPATALKIDASFIATIERDSRDRAIVESVVQLASTLQMGAVAEGVETRRQLEILTRMGCPMAQGFHIGRPGAPTSTATAATAATVAVDDDDDDDDTLVPSMEAG